MTPTRSAPRTTRRSLSRCTDDALVLESARAIGVPVVIVVAGGYGREIADTVRVHVNTARIADSFL